MVILVYVRSSSAGKKAQGGLLLDYFVEFSIEIPLSKELLADASKEIVRILRQCLEMLANFEHYDGDGVVEA
jgi:hypothetical protein